MSATEGEGGADLEVWLFDHASLVVHLRDLLSLAFGWGSQLWHSQLMIIWKTERADESTCLPPPFVFEQTK